MEEGTIDEATAQRIIEVERKKRITICEAEIRSILIKYNCTIDAVTTIQGNQLASQLVIRSN